MSNRRERLVTSLVRFARLYRVTQTRYCVKWKSSEGKLVLKITDDTTVCDPCDFSDTVGDFTFHIQCIKFKTYSSLFLNRFESLNFSLMQKMQNRRPDPPPSTATPQSLAVGDSSHPRAASPVPVTQTGTAAGGVKKKKPKKKK
ncbi:hypothetical protein JVT61DRAFT_14531 [Boletus reticuloceps]|uniref:Uncharacterized protein n=1 Tax=Boletus reticuloceps TaxID=495285 RepID=A0A8I2YVL6_9AGAM|nr:hypothetical protein JVT61DRAFT_14531 [Boletus reticuloceps]